MKKHSFLLILLLTAGNLMAQKATQGSRCLYLPNQRHGGVSMRLWLRKENY